MTCQVQLLPASSFPLKLFSNSTTTVTPGSNSSSSKEKIKRDIVSKRTSSFTIITFLFSSLSSFPWSTQLPHTSNPSSRLSFPWGQICTLHGKYYLPIGSYSFAICGVLCHNCTESEPLTLIGFVLANHHIFFLFSESKILSKVYLPTTFGLIFLMQKQFAQSLDFWDEKVEISIKSLNCSWFVVLLFHSLEAQNLTSLFRLTLIHNMEIQDNLKNTLELLGKTNHSLIDAFQTQVFHTSLEIP